jgi:hypothetical protein
VRHRRVREYLPGLSAPGGTVAAADHVFERLERFEVKEELLERLAMVHGRAVEHALYRSSSLRISDR